MKHTPGPWEIGEFWEHKQYRSQLYCEITPVGEFAILAHAFAPKVNQEEGKANAHLIAAAPDMYGALKTATSYLESFKGAWQEGEELLSEIMQAALKKAKGE